MLASGSRRLQRAAHGRGGELVAELVQDVVVRLGVGDEDLVAVLQRLGVALELLGGHLGVGTALHEDAGQGDGLAQADVGLDVAVRDRIERQQQMVAALRSQAFSLNTVKQLPTIVRVANRNVQTDLGLGQGVTLARLLVKRGPNSQMTAQQLKGDPETLENGDQVLVPDAEANDDILDEFRY